MSGPRALTDYDTSPKAPRSSSKTRIGLPAGRQNGSILQVRTEHASPAGRAEPSLPKQDHVRAF
jgi:hypothetical protein